MKKTIMKINKGSNLQLTSNFNSDELDCKCNYSSCKETLIDLEHVVKLQKLRELTGPLKITSGYRCEKHNQKVGGSKNSQHTLGTATDIQSSTKHPNIIQETCKSLFSGLGRYDTFTHVDSRERRARWDLRS